MTGINKPQTLHLLQIYRGLAALFVVCYHATLALFDKYQFHSLAGFFSWGFSGVHLFFVLSGFIICHIHFKDIGRPNRAGPYLYKRFARIYPVYWVILLISIPAFLASVKFLNGYQLFDNVTLLRTSNHDKIVAVAWTLSHEILFYLFFLALILNRVAGSILISAWVALVLYRLATGIAVMPPFTLSTFTGIDYGAFTNFFRLASEPINALFALGALSFLAARNLKIHPKREVITQGAIVVGVILFIIASVYWLDSGLGYTGWGPFSFVFGTAAYFLMVGSVSATAETWASKRSFLLFLGDASFSIYLVHYGLQIWMTQLLGPTPAVNLNLIFVSLILVPVVIGLVLHRTVEAPLLGFFGRLRGISQFEQNAIAAKSKS